MKKLKRALSFCLMLALILGQIPLGARPVYAAEAITGVTPVGTTIDLFDYWVDENNHNNDTNTAMLTTGINRHSDLKFCQTGTAADYLNRWTGSSTPGRVFPNIVQRRLGGDGYPVLSAGLPTGVYDPSISRSAGLGYLFNYYDSNTADANRVAGKISYPDIQGLLQVDANGYYFFDSSNTAAHLRDDGKTMELYSASQCVGFFPFNELSGNEKGYAYNDSQNNNYNHFFGSHMTTQFIQSRSGRTDQNLDVIYDFTGDDDVWIFIDGVLVGDVGGIHDPAYVNINFATGAVSYDKNGVSNTGISNSTIWQQYQAAQAAGDTTAYFDRTVTMNDDGSVTVSKTPLPGAAGANYAEVKIGSNTYDFQETDGNWIFADGTYHTLDFFYLERGAGGSNMQLKFNLEEIPPTYIQKVDQNGEGIGGVEFNLYAVRPADGTLTMDEETGKESWTVGESTERLDGGRIVATGVTDANGNLTLRYSAEMGSKQGKLASLADIFNTYQDGNLVPQVIPSSGLKYENCLLLELEEVSKLAGYRQIGSASLRLENINGTYILLSNDRWNNGVYASPNVIVSAPKIIYLRNPDGTTSETGIDLSQNQDGKVGLFGVVLAWIGAETPTRDTITIESNWAPVYGSPADGWTIQTLDLSRDTDYAKALGMAIGDYAAEHDGSVAGFVYPFSLAASGSYNTTIDNLPGEISQYYFMVSDNNGNIVNDADFAKIKYTTSFYYSEAPTYTAMDVLQTHRVNHRNSNFQRDFGSTIGVPNIQNRLLVQRLDAQGNTVVGAQYSLYNKNQVTIADDGTFTVTGDPIATAITENLIKDKNEVWPVETNAHITANGVAAFHGLASGEYYVIETQAPQGYAPNNKPVHVVVDDVGVHAYAGEAKMADGAAVIDLTKGIAYGDGDGISVLLGVGNLVSTMANFGSNGHIDTTLTDIYALRAKGEAAVVDGRTRLSWTQIDSTGNIELQRKWRVYDADAAIQYATANPATDILGHTNPLSDLENPFGYVSASGWNWDLIAQNYYGIYDPGMHYSELVNTADYNNHIAEIQAEISTKTALPTTDYKGEDDPERLDISNGYTSFGNKILNGLFSGSTAVRVAATAVGDLVISKTVILAADSSTDMTRQFAFAVSFTYDRPEIADNEEGRPVNMIGDIDLTAQLTGDYAYTITRDGTETETGTVTIAPEEITPAVTDDTVYHIAAMTADGGTTHFDAAAHSLKLAHGETITISGLPRGTAYTVTEEHVAGYQQAVNAAAMTDVRDINDVLYSVEQPVAAGLSVRNTIAVPGQTDTLAYTNRGDSGEYPYTVNYLEWKDGAATDTPLRDPKTGDAQAYGTEITAEAETEGVTITGYKYHGADKDTLRITADAANNVLNLYYEVDEAQTHELSYTVEYYKDGVKVEDDTQTETVEVQVLQNTVPVDKTKINTTDKYAGYRFDPETTGEVPNTVEDGAVISIYYVTDDGQTKNLTYTVEYYKDGARIDADTRTKTISVQVLQPDTLTVEPAHINITDMYYGYTCSSYTLNDEALTAIPQEVATGAVIKIYYIIDEDNRKDISYTVNYYKDGELAAADTQTETVSVQVLQNTAEVDKTKINITDKYIGYKCTTLAADIPDMIADGGVINVYYVKDDGQTKAISYTVEYYRDGVKVTGDTQTVTNTVHINDPDTLTVDKTAINTKNKYRGYYFTKSNPSPIPDTVENGAVIKIYYVSDSDDGGGDDSSDSNDNTPSDLNTTDHVAYVIGYPEGNVRPEGSITRAEAATIFFRLLTDDARAKHWSRTNDYTDVAADMWCNNAISTLSKMGIICGDPDGAFRPNDPITRAELAKISVGFFDTAGKVQSAQTYSDVPTGQWYARYVAAADMLKLVEGYPDKTFRPNNNITRAETCTMVNRILGRAPHADHLLAEDAMLTWPDNPASAWYYTQIQEATNSHDYRWIKVDGKRVDEWTAKLKERSWANLEKEWSDAYDAPGKDVTAD